MPLKDYQKEIDLDTLYNVNRSGFGTEQISPNIEVFGGTVDIYVSQVIPTGGQETVEMKLIVNGENFGGISGFEFIPRYLWVTENTATVTSIVLSGINAVEVI
jgi:hypothetical protein